MKPGEEQEGRVGRGGGEQEELWGVWGERRASSARVTSRGPPGLERGGGEGVEVGGAGALVGEGAMFEDTALVEGCVRGR